MSCLISGMCCMHAAIWHRYLLLRIYIHSIFTTFKESGIDKSTKWSIYHRVLALRAFLKGLYRRDLFLKDFVFGVCVFMSLCVCFVLCEFV